MNQRLIGLPKQQFLFGPEDNGQRLYSKVSYEYDAGGEFLADQGNPVQHDAAYSLGFVQGRGNVTKALRWDVNDETNIEHSTASSVGYNTTGSVTLSRDPLGNQTTISYADSFSSNGIDTTTAPGLTLAYPTTVAVYDPAPISSTAKYNYDLGVVTRTEGPPPMGHPHGAIQVSEYDSAGRVKRVTNAVNGAYTRFVYPTSQTIVNKFTTINELTIETYSATIFDGAGRVRAVAGDFPDNAGNHYSGQFTLYDQQGQAVQSANPTEMTHAWEAAGPEDHVGWISSLQTYDWKGRPLITTNPSITSNPAETTTKQASYDGCGCAGGAVVTLTDEGSLVDIDPGAGITNVVKKRQQKIYSDALGRTVKTEVLNWDGAEPFSVYSTIVNVYNARDQVTSVREYQGTEGSGVYHETSMTYDGYGRLKTKHVPEQQAYVSGSTDHTTWNYNDDDTVKTVTDARGITTTFGYNARHLLTEIIYPQNLPTGIPATANVTYGYDPAGNRSSMSDTSGNAVSYDYDTLSRLRSEARQFSGLTGTYTLAYEYNLVGQVNKVMDQSPGVGTSFSYTLDNVGRLTSVDSTGLGATAPLASNAQYRASGALKHRDSGNGTGMNLAYNGRGLMTQYSLSGVKESNGAARAEGSDYYYHADGQLKFASDLHGRAGFPSGMSAHDKSYEYDQVGRLKKALTGLMANNYLNGAASQFPGSGSYMQTNTYDEWDNLVLREGLYWSETNEIDPQTYQANNRNAEWAYDADGRLISMNEHPFTESPYVPAIHTYDASGQHVKVSQTTSRQHFDLPNNPIWSTVVTTDAGYDGDGQQIKRLQTTEVVGHSTTSEMSYYLRSSVLGQVITEYNMEGTRAKSYVYAGGAVIASGNSAGLSWSYNNPMTGNGLETDTQGRVSIATYLDPHGVNVGATDPANTHGEPPPPQPLPNAGAYAAYLPHSLGGSGQCSSDGMEISCGLASSLIEGGAGVQCPNNNCGDVRRSFNAYADGWSGYLPAGISYVGDGIILNSAWTGAGNEKVSFGDVEFGSLAQGLAASFTSPNPNKRTRRRSRSPEVSIGVDVGPGAGIFRKLPLNIENFDENQEKEIRAAINHLLSEKCAAAFKAANLKTPSEVAQQGLVIRPASLLLSRSSQQLGLMSETQRKSYADQFFRGNSYAQGGTVVPFENGNRNTTNGETQIYLRDSAFFGEDWLYFSLQDVMSHEFIHGGGQPPTPGFWGSFTHDLAGFKPHDGILKACR